MNRLFGALALCIVGCGPNSTIRDPGGEPPDGGSVSQFFDPTAATPAFGALAELKNPVIIAAGTNTLYIAADSTNPQALVWVSDGTRAGTRLVTHPSGTGIGTSFAVGDRLVYTNTIYSEVWSTDGTTAGTVRLLSATRTEQNTPRRAIENVVATTSRVWMLMDDGVLGPELYTTDGTPEGTRRLTSTLPLWSELTQISLYPRGDLLAMRVTGRNATGPRPNSFWISDGTVAGTRSLLSTSALTALHGGLLSVVGATLYFSHEDVAEGEELYTYGLSAGALIQRSLNPGSSSSYPREGLPAGQRLFFTAVNSSNRTTVYSVAPSQLTPLPVDSAGLVPEATNPMMAALGENAIIRVRTSATDFSLWRSDGTAGGSIKLASIGTSSGAETAALSGRVLFAGLDSANKVEAPWVTDGTPAGTLQLIATHDRGRVGSMVVLNGVAYGIAHTSPTGYQLFRTDGTPAGTRVLTPPGAREVANPLGKPGFTSFAPPEPAAPPVVFKGAIYVVGSYFGSPQFVRFDPVVGGEVFGSTTPTSIDPTCADVPTNYIGEVQFDTMCAAAVCYRRTGRSDRALAVCASMLGLVGPSPTQCPACQ